MSDASSAAGTGPSSGFPGIGDVLAMFGAPNIFAGIGKSIEQFRRGVADFLVAVENFNQTMTTLNGVASRVSNLLDDVEEPVRALMPQLTRSIKAADSMIVQISGPVEKVAPGIARLAETLSSPVFAAMPDEIANFLDAMGDIARRLQPLSQLAENAGSMFGLRSFSALLGGGQSSETPPRPPRQPARQPAPAPKAAPKKASAAKKAVAKKAVAKKAVAKKSPPKKAAPRR